MKQIVCREDIQAEMQILRNLQYDVSCIRTQLDTLQDRLQFLETKSNVINSINTAVNVPTRTGDTTYGQSMADLLDMRRAAAEAWNEQAQRISNDNWNDISSSNNN